MCSPGSPRARRRPRAGCRRCPPASRHVAGTGYADARALLAAGGVPFVAARTVTGPAGAVAAAAELGYPVVLKALGLLHKSDAGGVVVGLGDEAALTRAIGDLQARLAPPAFSVERMAPVAAGVELLAGARWDERFGPVVAVGLGGVYTEILRDVAVALAPVDAAEAARLLALAARGAAAAGRSRAPAGRRRRRRGGGGGTVGGRGAPPGARRARGQPAARDAGRGARARRARGGAHERRAVAVRTHGRACVLELRRERKLNALSTALEEALGDALEHPEVKASACVVVTGGARAFSAGADVEELRGQDPASILAYYRETGDVYERVAGLPQPTIAAISGYCLGGGLELALACDFRVADAGATFGLPEVAIGIVPSSGGTHRLVRMLGTARAKELVLLRDRVDAEEAHRLGLVTETAPEGEALDRSLALAERLGELPPLAVAVAKEAIDAMAESSRAAGLGLERLAYGMLAQTEDAREAAAAFSEKRPPRFRGR